MITEFYAVFPNILEYVDITPIFTRAYPTV